MVDRLPDTLSNNHRAGTEISTQDPEAADLRVRRDAPNHTGHSSAVPKDIDPTARLDLDLDSSIDDLEVVEQSETRQSGVINLDPGIDYGDPDAFPGSFFQGAPRFLQPERTRIWG